MSRPAAAAAGIALGLIPLQAHAAPVFPRGCAPTTATSSSGNWWVKASACLGDTLGYEGGAYIDVPATELWMECKHYSLGFWSERACKVTGTERLEKDGELISSGTINVTTNPHHTGEIGFKSRYACRGYGTYSYTIENLKVTDTTWNGETAYPDPVTFTATGC